MNTGEYVWIIYYDGRPYDEVQNVGRRYGRARSPRRIYWKEGFAKTALRGIVDVMEHAQSRSWRAKDEPVYDPSKFEIRKFRLVEEDSNESHD